MEPVSLDTIINSESASTIILITSDSTRVEVPIELAKQSRMISTAISMTNPSSNEINIPSVDSKCMNMIIKWLHMNNGVTNAPIPQPLSSIQLRDFMTEFNAQFFESIILSDLFKLTECANYLDIPTLFDQSCSTIASLIKKQTEARIKNILMNEKESYIKDIKQKYLVN